jgi:uncharacterized oligopeptide transporter (OPT) family protein
LSAKYAPERKAIVEERGTLLASGLIAGEANRPLEPLIGFLEAHSIHPRC